MERASKIKAILKGRRATLWLGLVVLVSMCIWYALCLPRPLFRAPHSTVLLAAKGELLSARTASDGQWRFPLPDSLPGKFVQAITYFEDQYFFQHPGFNPVSMLRAFRQNVQAGRIVSGASTLTMQTIRLARRNKPRSIYQKVIELIWATRLEWRHSKSEILKLYAGHAPFGGNVVGLQAAAWRYYGRSPYQLSWGETCALAVLPNAPSLVYPGKNHLLLKRKRDFLLQKLRDNKVIDSLTCSLAMQEPLPGEPLANAPLAPHLHNRLVKQHGAGKRYHTTLQYHLQKRITKWVDYYHEALHANEIHNMAVLVLEIETGKVLSYVGNSRCPEANNGQAVDVITAPRSTGSTLKPFLYALMMQEGELLPQMLVPDIPTQISGYAPQNFNGTFQGAVPAHEALAHSLNIPAVRLLHRYGMPRFYDQLRARGFPCIRQPASHYGLSLILGGAESSLWELSKQYMYLGQNLKGQKKPLPPLILQNKKNMRVDGFPALDRGAVWSVFEALTSLNRPAQERGWRDFQSSQKVAWKTGTSFGHRDAWAIGVTAEHVVGVWVGNANGAGRPGLTGTAVAAPLLFKIVPMLPSAAWFNRPDRYLRKVQTCALSGYPAGVHCDTTLFTQVPNGGLQAPTCPYHRTIHLDSTSRYRVNDQCYPVHSMQSAAAFVLPTVQGWYYKKHNPFYKPLPPFGKNCEPRQSQGMEIIYPQKKARVFIPREFGGERGEVVFKVAHRNGSSSIYWHLNEKYLGQTRQVHQMALSPKPGKHRLTLIDEEGTVVERQFEVVGR